MSSNLPPPIVFDLDVADSARIRVNLWAASGGRLVLPLLALGPLLQSGLLLLRLSRSGWSDPRDWVLLVVELSLLAVIVASLWWPRFWQRYVLRPQVGTSVSFDAAGVEIVRGNLPAKRAKRFVQFANIRSVRLMPDAFFVMGAVKPIVIIPRAALPDDGTQLMAYFEERLVSKRLLQRSPIGRTTIVNTASP